MSEQHDLEPTTEGGSYGGLIRAFCLFVLLPTIAGGIYFGLIASDRYVAEARYAIRSGSEGAGGGILEGFLGSGGMGGSSSQNAEIVRDYIYSHDMLAQLQGRIDIRAHYGSPEIDWLSRLREDTSKEELLEYFQDRIEVTTDPESNITTLRARAFDPETAKAIATHLLELSEQLVNEMSARITEDTLGLAREELGRAEAQVHHAIGMITSFRKTTRSINPGEETSAVLGIITGLETQLATRRTELAEAKNIMHSDSPQVQILEDKVAALKNQIAEERDRLSNTHDTDLTSLIDRYQPLELEQELAMQRYASALASLETARAEAQRQQSYLIAFVSPQLPSEAIEPKRARMAATVSVFAFIIFAVGGLMWSAVKDHMRI